MKYLQSVWDWSRVNFTLILIENWRWNYLHTSMEKNISCNLPEEVEISFWIESTIPAIIFSTCTKVAESYNVFSKSMISNQTPLIYLQSHLQKYPTYVQLVFAIQCHFPFMSILRFRKHLERSLEFDEHQEMRHVSA